MKIFIFGDSFFDEAQNSGKTWINMLRKLYEVENFSLSGTGPHYNLPLIVNMILNKTYLQKLQLILDKQLYNYSYSLNNLRTCLKKILIWTTLLLLKSISL